MAKPAIEQIREKCSNSRSRGLLVGFHSLPASLDCDMPPVDVSVICDLLLVSRNLGLHLFTLYGSDTEDHGQFMQYSHAAAKALKRKLVMEGGCREKFYVSYQIVDCSAATAVDLCIGNSHYPKSYAMSFTREKHSSVLHALVIVLARVPSTLSTKLGVHFLNLLTKEQFHLVKMKINDHREYWVQGAAGTGKSIVAVELMRELRRRDKNLEKSEILYVCENKGMRSRTE